MEYKNSVVQSMERFIIEYFEYIGKLLSRLDISLICKFIQEIDLGLYSERMLSFRGK